MKTKNAMINIALIMTLTTIFASAQSPQPDTRDEQVKAFLDSMADKDWYKQYFIDVDPKLVTGGCFTAHNVSLGRRGGYGTREFLEYVVSLPNYETTVDQNGGGLSISYKKAASPK
ncbi:MAG: hypothetical protein EHM72_10550 [Calditrichaeota bacterium]|nr:MAG: hypothetical protein EHM72_10550 [Calditrichota bacterium]